MILAVGATGSLGGKIANQLLERGETVRVLLRPAADAASLQAAGALVARGDLRDPASLVRACRGADILITTATASRRTDGTIDQVDRDGTLNLIDAAQDAGVRHFIYVSTLGASEQSPVPIFQAKGVAERRLKESGLTYTILQPGPFMDVWFALMVEMPFLSGHPVTLVGEARRRHSFIAEQDVAAFAVAAVRNPAARNATIVIGGPEPITFRDVVRAYEEASGQPISVRTVAPGQPIPGLPEPVWGLAAALESFDAPIPMAETAGRYGVALTGVRSFARMRVPMTAQ